MLIKFLFSLKISISFFAFTLVSFNINAGTVHCKPSTMTFGAAPSKSAYNPKANSTSNLNNQPIVIENVNMVPIGEGGFSKIYEGELKNQNNTSRDIVLRQIKSLHVVEIANQGIANMQPVLNSNSGKLFNEIIANHLDCEYVHTDGSIKKLNNVYILDRANGSVDQIPNLKLSIEEAALDPKEFKRKLQIINKFQKQGLEAIDALNKNGLVHSDIKPGNVLFKVPKGTNLSTVQAKDIEFQLADFDSVVKIGKPLEIYSDAHAAPEIIKKHIASNEQDLYALSTSVFEIANGSNNVGTSSSSYISFGEPSNIFDLKKPHEDFRKSITTYFDQFSNLNQADPELHAEVQKLKSFIDTGTSTDPKSRTQLYNMKNSDFIVKNNSQNSTAVNTNTSKNIQNIESEDIQCAKTFEKLGNL